MLTTSAIQGTRTYDPNSSQWTTPDAYAGDVSDPATQKSYMWNGNNPVGNADPSGYVPINPEMLADLDGADDASSILDDGAGETGDDSGDSAQCAATGDGACFQAGELIEPPVGTNATGFASMSEAAKAAQSAYSFIETSGEVGCALFCSGGDCGFGAATVALADKMGDSNLAVDFSPAVGAGAVGIWHRHPPGTNASFTLGHAANANTIFRNQPWIKGVLSIYTTFNGNLWIQQYSGIGSTLDPDSTPPSLVP